MSNDTARSTLKGAAVGAIAFGLAVIGVLLLFAPDEFGGAVVAANQTHLTIGAIVLVKHGLVMSGTPAFWLVTGFYVLGAGLFLYLLFFSSGIRRR